jgi:23S rRNA pseudouridine2605 synthase
MRLSRYLAQAGVAARRKAELLITEGRVRVNGKVITELGTKVDPQGDQIEVDGEAVAAEDFFYVLFNKPKGCITAVTDDRGRTTVMDYLPNLPVHVRPVGRLDYYSEGVLLLTNDGELAARLLAPASHVAKTYHVKVRGNLSANHLAVLRAGVTLEDGSTTRSAEVAALPGESRHSWVAITLFEGKSRQIHRMMEALGFVVVKLQRVAFATLTFHGLRVGDARELTQAELNQLRDVVGLDHSAVARGRWNSQREDTDIVRRAADKARAEAAELAGDDEPIYADDGDDGEGEEVEARLPPPPRRGPVSGRPVGERPARGAAGERPTRGGAGERPTRGGAGERPTRGGAGERPTRGAAGERPTRSMGSERPTRSMGSERPTSRDRVQAAPPRAGSRYGDQRGRGPGAGAAGRDRPATSRDERGAFGGRGPARDDRGGFGGRSPTRDDRGGRGPARDDRGGRGPARDDRGGFAGRGPVRDDRGGFAGRGPARDDRGGRGPARDDRGGRGPARDDRGGRGPARDDRGGFGGRGPARGERAPTPGVRDAGRPARAPSRGAGAGAPARGYGAGGSSSGPRGSSSGPRGSSSGPRGSSSGPRGSSSGPRGSSSGPRGSSSGPRGSSSGPRGSSSGPRGGRRGGR